MLKNPLENEIRGKYWHRTINAPIVVHATGTYLLSRAHLQLWGIDLKMH